MSKEKQIEEIAKEICKICSSDGECINVKKSIICKDAYKEAEALYNAGYHKQSEWISVEERLPDAIDSYIVVVKQKYEWEAEWEYDTDVASFVFYDGYIDGVWNTYNDWKEGQECHITHWMPLPEAPKMKGSAE